MKLFHGICEKKRQYNPQRIKTKAEKNKSLHSRCLEEKKKRGERKEPDLVQSLQMCAT